LPDRHDWGSSVLRDLGLTPTPTDAPREESGEPGAPGPVVEPAPQASTEEPASRDPTAEAAPSVPPVPGPPAPIPAPPVPASPRVRPAPPSDTAELPAVTLDDPPPEGGPEGPPELGPDRFTRAQHHREPAARRAARRIRVLLGVDASRELREATARAERLRQPVTTLRRLAVLSSRGGAGKTAVATLVATTLASSRQDRVLAVDAAPDLGSLALRAGGSSPRPVAAFGRDARPARGFAEVEPHLGRGDVGLWLLTGGDGPGDRLDLPAYQSAVAALSRFFAVLVTDCGPDPAGGLNLGILCDAHALALVTPATVDGVVSAHQALGWLRTTPAADLVQRTVVVLSTQTPHTEGVDLKRGARTLASQGVRVARLPYDRHLAAGARIHPNLLGERTRTAAIGLAGDLLTFAVSDRGSW
jgi:MinD-like ATPase involved in chromosome partitioning or flagellar assembly